METRNLDRIRFVTRHFNDLQGLRHWVPLGMITLSLGGAAYFSQPPLLLARRALFFGGLLLMLGARRYYRRRFGEVERRPLQPAAEPAAVSVFSPAGPMPRVAADPLIPPAARPFLFAMGLACALCLTLRALSPGLDIVVDGSLTQPPWQAGGIVLLYSDGHRALPVTPDGGQPFATQMLYALYGSFLVCLWFWRQGRPAQSYCLGLGLLLLGLSLAGTLMALLLDGSRGSGVPRFLLLSVSQAWIAVLLCGAAMILVGLLDHGQLVRTLGGRR